MRASPLEGFKRYQNYLHIGFEEISGLSLYRGSRDIKTTPIEGFERFQDYPFRGLQEI